MNRLPSWFKQELPGAQALNTEQVIQELGLHTVCRAALCPNMNSCFAKQQATFIILGESCTRNCRFCNISSVIHRGRRDLNLSYDEPQRISQAVKALGLKYVVITSVTRDDLQDGGASQFVEVIERLRKMDREIQVEVLIPDFKGNIKSLRRVVASQPFILGHNLETVERLYSSLRPQGDYQRSLGILKKAKTLAEGLITKSSLMLGFGEKEEEVIVALKDLRACGCAIVALGQYLAPSTEHYPVKEFISPEQFRRYYVSAMELGFKRVLSAPKVRSSYCAAEVAEAFLPAGRQEPPEGN